MSTYLEVKQAAANYLNIAIGDLTQNGQDLWLVASNEVRKQAELANDFEFSRKTLRVTVNGLTGGSLALATDVVGNSYEVKTVIEVGLLDTGGNLCPVEWTTTSESLVRQREDNIGAWPRYPTDGYSDAYPWGGMRFTFSGDQIMKWPIVSDTNAISYPLYLEAYTFSPDWTSADLLTGNLVVSGSLTPNSAGNYLLSGTDSGSGVASSIWVRLSNNPFYVFWSGGHYRLSSLTDVGTWVGPVSFASPVGSYTASTGATGTATIALSAATSDIWTTHGQKYLLWATLVQLNHIWRRWVPRQEGNLPPPAQLADEGLQTLIAWDAYRFEGFRQHNR